MLKFDEEEICIENGHKTVDKGFINTETQNVQMTMTSPTVLTS